MMCGFLCVILDPPELCIPGTRTRLGLGELYLVARGRGRRRHVGQQVRAQLEGAGHAPCDEVPVEDGLNPLGLYCLGRATADLHRIEEERGRGGDCSRDASRGEGSRPAYGAREADKGTRMRACENARAPALGRKIV